MPPHRQSFDLDRISHSAPIPAATRVGNFLFSSGIIGADPATGRLPDEVTGQAIFAFRNMESLVVAAGGDIGDVGHVRVLVRDDAFRAQINEQWLKYFPDPKSRPARHTVVTDLRGGMLIQLEITAVLK